MAEYCTVADLEEVRDGVSTNYGITDFTTFITEAGEFIDRAVTARFYRQAATDKGLDWRDPEFSRDQLPNDGAQLTKAAVFKTLELVFFKLAKVGNKDAYAEESSMFAKKFEGELREVLLFGIDYDWDEDDSISTEESNIRPVRRLQRG